MERKRRLLWVFALICSLLGISFFGGPVPYVFFYAMVVLPVAALVSIAFSFSFLRVYERTDGRSMVSGRPSDFYIILRNEGFFAISSVRISFYSDFSVITDMKEDAVYELLPGASVERKSRLICRYRGEYCVGIRRIAVTDPLGLFTVTRCMREPLTVIVEPRQPELEDLTREELFEDANRECFAHRSQPDVFVREYTEGDDVRLIHQKASALLQKPMIRERIGEEKEGIALVLDPERVGETEEEYIPAENESMEKLLAFCRYGAKNRSRIAVFYKQGTLRMDEIGDGEGYTLFYGKMVRYAFRPGESVIPLMEQLYEKGLPGGFGSCILLLQKWDRERADMASRLAERCRIKVYVAGKEVVF